MQEMKYGPNKSESKHGAGGRLQVAEDAAGGAAPKSLKTLGAAAAKRARSAAKPSAAQEPGFFGRMFPTLAPFAAPDAKLMQLANATRDANPADPAQDNPAIAAASELPSHGSLRTAARAYRSHRSSDRAGL